MLCEAEAFARAVYFQEYVGNALLVVHTTNGEALNTARRAHGKDYPLYVETGPSLPHFYLMICIKARTVIWLSVHRRCGRQRRRRNYGRAWKDGTILLTGSDDCTFDVDEKSLFLEKNPDGTWKQDFTKVVNGMSGIEIRLPLMISEGVSKGRISINKVCELQVPI